MILGIISDTHDKLPTIDLALALFARQKVTMVIHCGDWKSVDTLTHFAKQCQAYHLPLRAVLGNNDHDTTGFVRWAAASRQDILVQEGVMEIEQDGCRIGVYHGHHTPTLRRVTADSSYDILCLGHTHKPRIDQIDGRLIINPGSTAFAIPRSKQWSPTVVIADTMERTANIFSI